ncbi:hypothetical protein IQ07DRAFT_657320 [Pyrenochaeta sp. DS3sAY3a]|nr:hypothetical protein IQ07DRAFT_657320 [Pyrenochaeta sp. DS3sAY3a]
MCDEKCMAGWLRHYLRNTLSEKSVPQASAPQICISQRFTRDEDITVGQSSQYDDCLKGDLFLAESVAIKLYRAGVVTLTEPPKNPATQQPSASTLPTVQTGIGATPPPARVPVRNAIAPSEPDTLPPWEFMELKRKRKAQITAGDERVPLGTNSVLRNDARKRHRSG